jgi:hypothetical protein
MIEPVLASAIDPFFEIFHDGQWNACIGIQGNEQNYVDGYIEAALELASAVVDKGLVASRDTLAMPILYNARHAIELSLKFAINELHRIGVITTRHVPNHDILSHWIHLHDAKVGDTALRSLVTDLEPYVLSLARIDDDGQELRYPTNQNGKKSLDNIAIVNLLHIRRSLEAMSDVLTNLKYRIFNFVAERDTGAFTLECSRRDLITVASMLGDHASWVDDSFNDKKASIREQFGLSNNQFSRAVDKIRESRPLAALIGLETSLKYLNDEKAVFALEQWAIAYPLVAQHTDKLGIDYFDRDWEKVEQQHRVTNGLIETIIANLSSEEISDLEVLFYLGRNNEFGEHYEVMIKNTLKQHKHTTSGWESAHHIMTKMNLLTNVILGAKAAGRPSLATKLRAIRPE